MVARAAYSFLLLWEIILFSFLPMSLRSEITDILILDGEPRLREDEVLIVLPLNGMPCT